MIARLTTFILAMLIGASCGARAAEAQTFQEVVQPYVDQGRFVGASGVILTRDGIVGTPSSGVADFESNKPFAWNTMFWIASASKPFQATAVMMLVDEGKLKLDDPVSRYLPRFAKLKPMTVRMLLNHTNGLSYSAPDRFRPTDCCSLADEVDRFASLPLMFDPGTRFQYSNAGPDTASRIVEVISKQPFETFISERLLKPLGMTDTTYFQSEEQISRLAPGCMVDAASGKLVRAPNEVFLTSPYNDRKVRHAPGGGLFTTRTDLALFLQMLLSKGTHGGKRYLSEAAVAEMTRNQVPPELASTLPPPPPGMKGPMGYGLGWGVTADGVFFHTGISMTVISVDPNRGYGTAVLSPQTQDPTGFEILSRLIAAANLHWDENR
jgi:CubicO group peptidase (beta-lactamase class C family)